MACVPLLLHVGHPVDPLHKIAARTLHKIMPNARRECELARMPSANTHRRNIASLHHGLAQIELN
jgi:hypothetical protein